jgi:[ribosomal protein S5]-alanine N-acetyltransferase
VPAQAPAGGLRVLPLRARDAAALARFYREQRDFLAPYNPLQPDVFFTDEGQRRRLEQAERLRADDRRYEFKIELEGELVGTISVSNVVRGAFQSASVGYGVARQHNGRGIASLAVAVVTDWGFEECALHRLEAGTLLHNAASQRVLARNGYRLIGIAPRYLELAGRWQDHVLFARTVEDEAEDLGPPGERIARLRAALDM